MAFDIQLDVMFLLVYDLRVSINLLESGHITEPYALATLKGRKTPCCQKFGLHNHSLTLYKTDQFLQIPKPHQRLDFSHLNLSILASSRARRRHRAVVKDKIYGVVRLCDTFFPSGGHASGVWRKIRLDIVGPKNINIW